MAELKTKPTRRSVTRFLASIKDARRRRECREVARMMRAATGKAPEMWGTGIVGFGRFRYRYDSGRSGEWFLTGFSPRKQALTVYIIAGVARYPALRARLGRFTTGSSCLYLRSLDDVDRGVLRTLIRRSVRDVARIFSATSRRTS